MISHSALPIKYSPYLFVDDDQYVYFVLTHLSLFMHTCSCSFILRAHLSFFTKYHGTRMNKNVISFFLSPPSSQVIL